MKAPIHGSCGLEDTQPGLTDEDEDADEEEEDEGCA